MPAWFRRMELVVGCVSVGVVLGLDLALWLGPKLQDLSVAMIVSLTLALIPVPLAAMEVAIRVWRLVKWDDHQQRQRAGVRQASGPDQEPGAST